jgi:hypothetical protein
MKTAFKEKARKEFKKYLVCFVYLALFFSAFAAYRALVLAEYSLGVFHFGFAILEALVIAKIILLGETFGLGEKRFAGFPLLVPTFYKTALFSLFIGIFMTVEHYLSGWLHGKDWRDITHEFIAAGSNEILARTLVKAVALIPFFAFLELDRILGEGRLYRLFFHSFEDS